MFFYPMSPRNLAHLMASLLIKSHGAHAGKREGGTLGPHCRPGDLQQVTRTRLCFTEAAADTQELCPGRSRAPSGQLLIQHSWQPTRRGPLCAWAAAAPASCPSSPTAAPARARSASSEQSRCPEEEVLPAWAGRAWKRIPASWPERGTVLGDILKNIASRWLSQTPGHPSHSHSSALSRSG